MKMIKYMTHRGKTLQKALLHEVKQYKTYAAQAFFVRSLVNFYS